MRWIQSLPVCGFALLSVAPFAWGAEASVPAGHTPTAVACKARVERGDLHEYVCQLVSRAGPRHYRVAASFAGSHDDTMASLAASIGGAPIDCDAGSKTRTGGEDGDVTLECRFVPAGDDALELLVTVKWTHAQFADFVAVLSQ